MQVILKPRCRYSLLTCLIPYSMLFIFRFLTILPVENRICRDMVLRNPMLLVFTRLQHRVIFLYLSRTPLVTYGTTSGYVLWTLWWDVLTYKCGTLGPQMSSDISKFSWRIGKIWRMLFSTACRIHFTGRPVMCWNRLTLSYLFISRVV